MNHIGREARSSKSELFALISFCLAIILPQGIGIRFSFSLPHIDLPRIFIVSTILYGGILFLMGRWRKCIRNAPVSCLILITMAIWFLLTACFAASPQVSILFALRMLTIGPLYALAFCALVGGANYKKERYFFCMTLTAGILVLIANFEFIFQTHLIPSALRTSFYNFEYYRAIIETTPRRAQGLLPRGSYITNQNLGGILCVFSGFAWWALERKKTFGIIFASMFIIAIYAIGSRASTIAVIISIVAWLIYRKSIKNIARLSFVIFIAAVLVSFKHSPETMRAAIFFASDITCTMDQASPKKLHMDPAEAAAVVEKLPFSLPANKATEKFLYNSGTVGMRLTGALLNISRIENWWLLGYGPGAFFIPDKMPSIAVQYDDPGLFLAFMFESGLFMAMLFGILILRSLGLGFRNAESDAWIPALGILSWSVASLSSWAVWPMLPALVMIVLVEVWSKNSH